MPKTSVGRVYCVNKKIMVCLYPPEMFKAFKLVYVLTYIFGGSQIKLYFDKFKISYELRSIERDAEGNYSLCKNSEFADYTFRKKCRELITIYGDTSYKRSNLSKSWYESAINSKNSDELAKLKNKLKYNLLKLIKAKSADIMWTCPKPYMKHLSGKGYQRTRKLTDTEKTISIDLRDNVEIW